jgi:hypothetical protein
MINLQYLSVIFINFPDYQQLNPKQRQAGKDKAPRFIKIKKQPISLFDCTFFTQKMNF